MRVTVCQLDNRPGVLARGWDALKTHVATFQSELLVLPEMPFDDWLAAAKDVDPARWSAAAAAHETWLGRLNELGTTAVASSRPVVDSGRRLNRGYVRHPDGTVGDVHDKYYLPDETGFWEASWYERGAGSFDVTQIGNVTAGMLICTDIWFLERSRQYGKDGADLLLFPRATPHYSLGKWVAGGATAAVVAGAYCLSSNLYNPPGDGADLGGLGFIADPEGQVLVTTTPETPVVTIDLDMDAAATAKRTYPRYVKD